MPLSILSHMSLVHFSTLYAKHSLYIFIKSTPTCLKYTVPSFGIFQDKNLFTIYILCWLICAVFSHLS